MSKTTGSPFHISLSATTINNYLRFSVLCIVLTLTPSFPTYGHHCSSEPGPKYRLQLMPLNSSSFLFILSPYPLFFISFPPSLPLSLLLSIQPICFEYKLCSRYRFIFRDRAVMKTDQVPALSGFSLASIH